MTKAEQITNQSYDRVAGAWESDHWTPKFWGENFDKFYKLLPRGRVLEIGCGTGRDAQELIAHGYDYLGTDISRNLLAKARINNPDGKFERESLYDLDFDEPFDGFWCAAVLVHVPKARIDEAMEAIKRNLKTQAIGFIAIKQGEGERVESRPELDNAEFLFTYWQNAEFKEVLDRHKMKVLHEGYMPFSERTKWLTYIVESE